MSTFRDVCGPGISSAPLDFGGLVAPLTPSDLSALWLSRTYKYQQRSSGDLFDALLDWDTLWRLIVDKIIPLPKMRLTYGRRIVPPRFYSDGDEVNPERLAQLLVQGASLIIVQIEPHVPAINAACRDAAAHCIRIVEAGAVVTVGGGGALKAHYDLHDLIILQQEGCKRWRIYGPRIGNPVRAMATKNPPRTAPLLDIVLQPGDILFLPAGFWHECDNRADRSLHVGLFMNMPACSGDAPVTNRSAPCR